MTFAGILNNGKLVLRKKLFRGNRVSVSILLVDPDTHKEMEYALIVDNTCAMPFLIFNYFKESLVLIENVNAEGYSVDKNDIDAAINGCIIEQVPTPEQAIRTFERLTLYRRRR
ncbi:hypothetical protein ACFE04_009665 [Oxalis oulophora]